MTPKTDAVVSATSYTGAAGAIVAGLTLTDLGIIVGIVTAILTLAINLIYQHRKDRREQKLWELQIGQIEKEQNGE